MVTLASAIGCGADDSGDNSGTSADGSDADSGDDGVDGSGDDGSGGGDDGDTGSAGDGGGDDGDTDGGTEGSGDGGGDGGGDLADCEFDSGLTFDPTGEVLQLQSMDESWCVRIERFDTGESNNDNDVYEAVGVHIGTVGSVSFIEDLVCWYSSHHNFQDILHAESSTRHFDVRLTTNYDEPWTYELFLSEPLAGWDGTCGALQSQLEDLDSERIELVPYNP